MSYIGQHVRPAHKASVVIGTNLRYSTLYAIGVNIVIVSLFILCYDWRMSLRLSDLNAVWS